ncbi:MAG TPA: FAD-binding oxidoreductase, partial [Bacillota bacterium]|nr:FAD-binding oxidoreductase [Bacillota bacterium]
MKHAVLSLADIDYLRDIFGERLFVGEDINTDFGHDEMGSVVAMPEALVQAVSRDEVVALLRYAQERRIPVTPRGQGTGLVGGCVPLCGGILLDLSKMNRIVLLDEDNLSLVVEPGVLLMEVSQYVEERGLFYPPDPGEKCATIGGNISTNAG